jgi:hypothetical protein
MLVRFATAWRALERAVRRLSELPSGSDVASVIRDLHDRRIVGARLAEELHQIRRARNQLTHYPASAAGDPYFVPTAAVVSRMVEIADLLRSPTRFDAVAVRAVCTRSDASMLSAIDAMRRGDFDHLPYLCDGNWCVVTREQVARMVELHLAGDEAAAISPSTTVSDVARMVGPRRPVHLPPDAAVPVVAESIARSAKDGYARGFAPVALCIVRGRPLLATLSDLAGALLEPGH